VTVVVARYFPAIVQLPGELRPRRKAYVILAQGDDLDGLHVWSRPGETADVHLPVNWERTVIPAGRGARNGFSVYLADGDVAIITVGGQCRCGVLGRWSGPAWATTVTVSA
jgi:hypothetical protein